MAIEYFGNQSADSDIAMSGLKRWNDDGTVVFTCPGSGNMTLKELAAVATSAGNIRVGLYSSAGSLIAQGATELVGANGWTTHTTFVDSGGTPVTPTLTGGTNYLIAVTGDGAVRIDYLATANGAIYSTGDETGGMSANLAPEGGSSALLTMRAGVEAASGGGLAGSISGTSTISDSIFITKGEASGIVSTSSASGSPMAIKGFAGPVSDISALSGSPMVVKGFAGPVAGTFALSGNTFILTRFTGPVAGVSALSGSPMKIAGFASPVSGQSVVTGELSIVALNIVLLSGAIAGTSSIIDGLGIQKSFTVVAPMGVATLLGELGLQYSISSGVINTSQLNGNLSIYASAAYFIETILENSGVCVIISDTGTVTILDSGASLVTKEVDDTGVVTTSYTSDSTVTKEIDEVTTISVSYDESSILN